MKLLQNYSFLKKQCRINNLLVCQFVLCNGDCYVGSEECGWLVAAE